MAYGRGGKKSAGRKTAKKSYGKGLHLNNVQSAMLVAQKAWKMAKYMRGMINCEKHYADTQYNGPIDWTGALNLLTGVAQGDAVNNRNGNSILTRSLYFRQTITMSAGANVTQFRLIIFMDKQNDGIAPTVADILQVTGTAAAPLSPLNVAHTSRYKILRDHKITLTAVNRTSVEIKDFIKLMMHNKYTGPNATDVYTNAIYVLNICDNTVSFLPNIVGVSRHGFYDN